MKSTVVNEEGVSKIKMCDPLDEHAKPLLDTISGMITEDSVVFNCKDLTAINSFGAKDWVQFVAALNASRIVFDDCSYEFVCYANVLGRSFLGKGNIKSLHVPYYCRACSNETLILHILGAELFENGFDTISCTKCNADVEAEIDAEDFARVLAAK